MSRRFSSYLLLLFCMISIAFSCRKGDRLIPKSQFAEIYAEMFVLDQWLNDNTKYRKAADTSLVYAPVLEKYGYTYNDYMFSVEEYMRDPARYSRILRETSDILNERLGALKEIQRSETEEARRKAHLDSLISSVDFDMDSVIRSMIRVHPTDSLVAGPDSNGFISFAFRTVYDTVYNGPEMVIVPLDSLKHAADSLTVSADSSSLALSVDSSAVVSGSVEVVVDADSADVSSTPVSKPEKLLKDAGPQRLPSRNHRDLKRLGTVKEDEGIKNQEVR